MPNEFEAHVLDINIEEISKKLRSFGAEEESEVLMKRWVFIINDETNEWIRLRDNGKTITLTYKCKKGQGISETEELEVEVEDFEKTAKILSKLDFKNSYYQENKRHLFKLKRDADDIEFCIDTWPKIPPHLEVESSSEEKVLEGLKMLGLEGKDKGNISIKEIYKIYGIDIHSFKVLKF
jgi:adenylate cyclase, class 2